MKNCLLHIAIIISSWGILPTANHAQPSTQYFKIKVIDEQTNRGVPLVELKTNNNIRYYTDNNGIIAFYEPDLMDQQVFFHVSSHGYEYPEQGFGFRGATLQINRGGSTTLKIQRTNVAERFYRITGQGLYHHSQVLGLSSPLSQTNLKVPIMGQDGGYAIPFNNKLYWFWGDSNEAPYPLGNFGSPGAISDLPEKGGLDPGGGIKLKYFADETGRSKATLPSSHFPGPGPRWLTAPMVLKDKTGKESLIVQYERIKDLGEPYERGLAVFNDTTSTFEKLINLNLEDPIYPNGRTFKVNIEGQEYFYFSVLYPDNMFVRVKADWESITDPSSYEAFTCLAQESRYHQGSPSLDRDHDGRLKYSWKAKTDPISYGQEQELIKSGHMRAEEAWFHFTDFDTGQPVNPYSGSVHWNEFRKRWVMIVQQNMGDVYYLEGDTPTGPWVYARKVVSHNRYNFYLPTHHPFFDQEGGRFIFFEGTYTNSFSGNPDKTPRYDYNQIMYRLDLDRPEVHLPVPVYLVSQNTDVSPYSLRENLDSLNLWEAINDIPFFAIPPDRSIEGSIPVYSDWAEGQFRMVTNPKEREPNNKPLFYGLPESLSEEDIISGAWDCSAEGFPFRLDLEVKNNKLNGTIAGQSLEFKGGIFFNDSIRVLVTDTVERAFYTFTFKIAQDSLNGRFKVNSDGSSGRLSGRKQKTKLERLFANPSAVPLFEYQNVDGSFFYSTNPSLRGKKRSEKPICRVWKNPSETIFVDYQAKPVLFSR